MRDFSGSYIARKENFNSFMTEVSMMQKPVTGFCMIGTSVMKELNLFEYH